MRSAALGLVVGMLAGGTATVRLELPDPARRVCVVLALSAAPPHVGSAVWAFVSLALLLVLGGDLAWQATHQDQPLRWLRESQIAPEPAGSAAFLLARQRTEGPFRIATAAPEPTLVHQLGAHRSRRARALLLDQEAFRLGLEDVAGYNPVHLKRYNRLMLASNGGREVDRHFELALRYATPQLRSLAVRYYVSPPGESPPGLPVVYRDRLSVVTRDDAACRSRASCARAGAAGGARRLARPRPHRDRPAGAGPPVVADLVYPGWRVRSTGAPPGARGGRPARRRGAAGCAQRRLDVHPAGRSRRDLDHARRVRRRRRPRGRAVAAERAGRAAVPTHPGSPSTEGVQILPEPADACAVAEPLASIVDDHAVDPHAAAAALARLAQRTRDAALAAVMALVVGLGLVLLGYQEIALPACAAAPHRLLRRRGCSRRARRARRASHRPAFRVPDPRGRAGCRAHGEHAHRHELARALARLVFVAEGIEPAPPASTASRSASSRIPTTSSASRS